MGGSFIWNGTKSDFLKLVDYQKSSRIPLPLSTAKFIQEWNKGQAYFEQKTSGSTGIPKIISISRQQMVASAKRTAKVLQIENKISALLCINPDFIGGKMMLVRAMEFDWELTIVEQSANPLHQLETVQNFSFAAMVPIQVENLLKSPEGILQLNSIDTIIIGGAAIGADLEQKIQPLKCQMYSTYGMTETVSHIALKKLNGEDKSDYFTILEGIETAVDERDCLRIKGDVTLDKWVQTNDIVALKGHTFQWLGRADFVINSGGIKIQLDALESQISKLLGKEIYLLKTSHPTLGETYVVVKEKEAGFNETSAISFLKNSVPKYHSPNRIFELDHFPKTASGKIDRQAMKQQLGLGEA